MNTPKIVITATALIVALFAFQACAPKASKLDAPITKQLAQGMEKGSGSFDHAAFDGLLRKHLDTKTGRVNYSALQTDRAALDSYIKAIGKVDVTELPRDEQLALLINAYNAFTLQLIIDNLDGLKSIKDISAPWDTPVYTIARSKVSLNDIEHGLIRPIYKDPRIHFAVNCASIGCPPLAASAYTGPDLEKQLAATTKAFATNPEYVRVKSGKLELSKILDWYGGDFTDSSYKGHSRTVANYLKPLVNDEVRAFIEKHKGRPPTDFIKYNWNLNKQ